MRRFSRNSAVALVLIGVSACSTASLQQVWRDPNYGSRPVRRVLVIGVTPRGLTPAQFEDALAQALIAKGFQAATASGVFPPGPLNSMKVQQFVDANEVDLIVMERFSAESTPSVAATTVTTSSGWYGAYGQSSYTVTTVSQSTKVTAKYDVFNVHTDPDTLIWSGLSSSFDLQGSQTAAQSLASSLTNDLIRTQILVK